MERSARFERSDRVSEDRRAGAARAGAPVLHALCVVDGFGAAERRLVRDGMLRLACDLAARDMSLRMESYTPGALGAGDVPDGLLILHVSGEGGGSRQRVAIGLRLVRIDDRGGETTRASTPRFVDVAPPLLRQPGLVRALLDAMHEILP